VLTFPALPLTNNRIRKQGGAKAGIQRQNGGTEPLADQRAGNKLRTLASFPVVQQQAISVVVVTAGLFHKGVDFPALSWCQPYKPAHSSSSTVNLIIVIPPSFFLFTNAPWNFLPSYPQTHPDGNLPPMLLPIGLFTKHSALQQQGILDTLSIQLC